MDRKNLKLSSGRELSYRTWGSVDADPLIFFHGFPGSSIQGELIGSNNLANRFRIYAFDRPGFGRSTFQAGRALADMPMDIAEAVNQLGFTSFHLIGVSGGSPYAIATAAFFGANVKSLTLICPLGPIYSFEFFRFMSSKAKLILLLTKFFPSVTSKILSSALGSDSQSSGRSDDETSIVEKFTVGLPPSDIAIMTDKALQPILKKSLMEATEQGVAGPIQDIRIFMKNWNLNLDKITAPVVIYHGGVDKIVPSQIGKLLSEKLFNSRFVLVEGEGHYSLPIRCVERILSEVPSFKE